MGFFNSKKSAPSSDAAAAAADSTLPPKGEAINNPSVLVKEQRVTMMAIWLGAVASIGGFMFGYVRYGLRP